jgi:hypothetical protein
LSLDVTEEADFSKISLLHQIPNMSPCSLLYDCNISACNKEYLLVPD